MKFGEYYGILLVSKPVVLTDHVKLRMKERGITLQEIRFTLSEPHHKLPTKDPKRERYMRDFGRNILDVIFEDRRDYILVITAMWLRRGDRKVEPK